MGDDLVERARRLADEPNGLLDTDRQILRALADEIERLQAENDAWRGEVINDELLWEDVINALRARGFQRQNNPRQNQSTSGDLVERQKLEQQHQLEEESV